MRSSVQPVVRLLLALTAGGLALFVLYPLLSVFQESFRNEVGEWTGLENYWQFLTSPYFRKVFFDTIWVGLVVTTGSVGIGLVFAYGLTRTDIPGKPFFTFMALLPMITPPFVSGFAFILLLGRNGIVNQWLQEWFGVSWIIYGWDGIIVAEIINYFPLAYLATAGAFSALNRSLEQAAADLGARDGYVLRTITLPLITPAITSGALLVFMSSLSAFGVPALLGGGLSVLAVEAVQQTLGLRDWGMGTTIAVILLIPTLLVYFFQQNYRSKASFVTVTGSLSMVEPRPTPGRIKWPIFTVCLLVSAAVLAQYLVVVAGSFSQVWGIDNSFSLRHYGLVLRRASSSILGTMELSVVGALAAALVGLLIGYLVTRPRYWGRRVVDFIGTLPYAVPGTMMGLGFITAFNRPPLALVGTAWIVLLDFIIRRMPFALRNGSAVLRQIDISLEEASADLGARWGTTFRRIVLPLLRPALVGGFIFAFIRAVTELTSTIFLVSPKWRLMAVDIYNYVSAGQLGGAAALSTILVTIVLVVLGIIYRFTGIGVRVFKM